MSTHISESDICEKKLTTQSIPHNVKETQKSNKYIKKLLSENKKLTI